MAAEVNGRRVRRTQAERSAAMRTRLLDATIECLVTYGYAGTTTPRVAELRRCHPGRADPPLPLQGRFGGRGHRASRATTRAGRDPRIRPRPGQSATRSRRCWTFYGRPTRARCSLPPWNFGWRHAPMRPGRAHRAGRAGRQQHADLRDRPAGAGPSGAKELRNFVYTAMDALRGILLASFVDRDPARARRRWDRACEHLRIIAAGLLAADRLD